MNNKEEHSAGRFKGGARPLALHVRRHRRWHGRQAITQRELARIAGVTVDLVHRYEDSQVLPLSVVALLRIALALEVAIEDLIAPELLAEFKREVERTRKASRGSRWRSFVTRIDE